MALLSDPPGSDPHHGIGIVIPSKKTWLTVSQSRNDLGVLGNFIGYTLLTINNSKLFTINGAKPQKMGSSLISSGRQLIDRQAIVYRALGLPNDYLNERFENERNISIGAQTLPWMTSSYQPA
jgi:hypothetical protein